MNNENLIPLTERPEEEARKIRSMGGKASAKKAREKKYKRLYAELIFETMENEEYRKAAWEEVKNSSDALYLKKLGRKKRGKR